MTCKLTGYERVENALLRKKVDLLPVHMAPWKKTIELWKKEGHIKDDEDVFEHFDDDIRQGGFIDFVADMDYKETVIEETETTVLKINGNGAKLRWHKGNEGTPEHVDFNVKDKRGWEELIKPHLIEVDNRRIAFEDYRDNKKKASHKSKYFCWGGVGPFEQMHPVCGHENLLMGMALDPDWVKDMVMTYAQFTINHLEILFAQEGIPDAIWFFEDMGYKFKPFMSPQMYKEIIFPGHKYLFDFAHSKGCKVIVHSCGYVEPLIPDLIEAGMNCLQALEVKAGMDLPVLFKKFGDKITFFGGVDARSLMSNDYTQIDNELQQKVLPVIQAGGGYILHSDHSEPPQVKYETMKYFIERGRHLTELI